MSDCCDSNTAKAQGRGCTPEAGSAVQGFDPASNSGACGHETAGQSLDSGSQLQCSTQAGSSCCDGAVTKAGTPSPCCGSQPAVTGGCCEPPTRVDWLLWSTLSGVIAFYVGHLTLASSLQPVSALGTMAHSVYALINTMWWGIIAAAVFVGVLGRVPRELVMAVLGPGGRLSGILRATFAGVLMDLCSHGILMVGMKLYERGASVGQVFAFLIASPWNSFSLTIILVALIGLPWTLLFIAASMLVGVIAGLIADVLVSRGRLPANPHRVDLPVGFHFWLESRRLLAQVNWTPRLVADLLWDGIKGSRMVLRWLFLGVLIAAAVRGFVPTETFQAWFGPTLIGLLATLLATTVIEVCSEGSTPIAADLLTRAAAPGNAFTFLMAGVATDYTEIMSIRDTTGRWKLALALPLLTVPQVILLGWIMNQVGG